MDEERSDARSKELREIVIIDQRDRENFFNKTPTELHDLAKRDSLRRKRVGEIFLEGCFATAQDFAAGALVYQHGDSPEHYLKAYRWASKAVELGDASQRQLSAMAIDRYLVALGRRQLFGSQAHRKDLAEGGCWCLKQVEEGFPDEVRKSITGKTLLEALTWVRGLNPRQECPVAMCSEELLPSPRGIVPGLW